MTPIERQFAEIEEKRAEALQVIEILEERLRGRGACAAEWQVGHPSK
jgi:hypothetical protein